MTLVEELRMQIAEWRKQQDQIEEMIEAAYKRIDEEMEREIVSVRRAV